MIDLQHLVNPLGPSPKAVEAIKNNLSDIHKYTGPLKELIGKIAEMNGVKEDQILLSDGADGALTLIATSIFKGKHIVIPQPCFHRYKDYPAYLGIDYNLISPKDSIFFDEDAILQSTGEILLVASPNNPTGFEISEEFLFKALRKFQFVILDETLSLSLKGKENLIEEHPNLIIIRSFSKLYGLAGLRVGYILCAVEHIQKIRMVSTPFKVNYLGQVAALAALEDLGYLRRTIRFFDDQRNSIFSVLADEKIRDSRSISYCLYLTKQQQLGLEEAGILLQKDMGFGYGANSGDIFRAVIGNPKQNSILASVIKRYSK